MSRIGRVFLGVVVCLALGLPTTALAGVAADTDHDGIPDVLDKCTLDSRNATPPSTCDTDCDGYGNVCDADFDQSFATNANDFTKYFVPSFKTTIPGPTGTD